MAPQQAENPILCSCTNPFCDLNKKLKKNAAILDISLQTSSFFLSTLKATASAAPIPGLKELAGGLLQVVVAIQDKNEVKGGFRHIIVDCCRVTCVVCEHAKRRNWDLTPVIKRAIWQLTHDLNGIREYAQEMKDRSLAMRFIMSSADKAKVNEWRQRLTTSWGVFTTELLMDTNYQVNKIRSDDGAEVAKLLEKAVEQAVEKSKGSGAAMEYIPELHGESSSSPAPEARKPKRRPAQMQQNDQPQGDYQYPQNESPANNAYSNGGDFYSGDNFDDPQTYDSSQQGEHQPDYSQYQDHPQQQHYSRSNANPFRSQTTYPARPLPQQAFSDPGYYGHPSGYSTPYDDHYGYGYHQPHPPPHRYYTLPVPPPSSHGSGVNNIGSVTNANFGVNHGTITQHAY